MRRPWDVPSRVLCSLRAPVLWAKEYKNCIRREFCPSKESVLDREVFVVRRGSIRCAMERDAQRGFFRPTFRRRLGRGTYRLSPLKDVASHTFVFEVRILLPFLLTIFP